MFLTCSSGSSRRGGVVEVQTHYSHPHSSPNKNRIRSLVHTFIRLDVLKAEGHGRCANEEN